MIKMYKWLSLVGAASLVASTVQAIPTLVLTDSLGNSVTVSSASGVVGYNGALGNWDINVTTGIASPPGPGGSPSFPILDLNSINAYSGSGAGNVLTITFYDDFLGPFAGSLNNSVGGTESGSTTFTTLVDGTAYTTQSFNTASFSDDTFSGVNTNFPAVLGIQAVITSDSGTYQITSFDDHLSVPDGGSTLVLLGLALSGLGLTVARKARLA